jgi:hypothetical protein
MVSLKAFRRVISIHFYVFFILCCLYDEVPYDEVPYDEVPYDEVPYDEVPYDEVPYDEVPYDEVPYDEVSWVLSPREGRWFNFTCTFMAKRPPQGLKSLHASLRRLSVLEKRVTTLGLGDNDFSTGKRTASEFIISKEPLSNRRPLTINPSRMMRFRCLDGIRWGRRL